MIYTSSGQLTVRPLSASLTREKTIFLKMSPYCLCIMGGFTAKSKPDQHSGKTPKWADIFSFNRSQESDLIFQVFNQNILTNDDLLGECHVQLAEILNIGRLESTFPLKYKGAPAGFITVRIEWKPFALPNNNQMSIQRPPSQQMNYNQNMNNMNNKANYQSPLQAPYQAPLQTLYQAPLQAPYQAKQAPYQAPLQAPYQQSNLFGQPPHNFVNNNPMGIFNSTNNRGLFPNSPINNNNNNNTNNMNNKNQCQKANLVPQINEVKLNNEEFEYPKQQEMMNDMEFQKFMSEKCNN